MAKLLLEVYELRKLVADEFELLRRVLQGSEELSPFGERTLRRASKIVEAINRA